MRASQYLIATLKETPADAEVVSHQLMLRAGLIRRLASGLYTWLPLGLRVLRKIEHVVREEMDRTGAMELLMPVVQPSELWQESGRWQQYGPELLRIQDRHERAFCLGPTHEEVITDLIRQEVQSYKQLPANFYQIQTKFRDEVRPRFGVMRAREFIMKDSYSFHLDQVSLQQTYDAMHAAYTAIFTRLGLDFRPVLADTGSIGGTHSHEFHVLAGSGEDNIAFSDSSSYAANVEMAEALAPTGRRPEATQALTETATPGQRTIEEVCDHLGIQTDQIAKTLIVKGSEEHSPLIALVLRGDHKLSETKSEKLPLVASPLVFADEEEIKACTGCSAGSLGPIGLSIPTIVDRAAAHLADFVCGANRDGFHFTGANWERDCPAPEIADIREVVEGDPSPDGHGTLIIRRGIEVGHIFQLGNKYSDALGAKVLNEEGREQSLIMGCYGIGVSRVVAAAIEQNNDENGIIWPETIAPFQIALIPINLHKSEAVRHTCTQLYDDLCALGYEVLYMDEAKARLGAMLADTELMGIPHRLVIGERGLEGGTAEYKGRRDLESRHIPLIQLKDFLAEQLEPR